MPLIEGANSHTRGLVIAAISLCIISVVPAETAQELPSPPRSAYEAQGLLPEPDAITRVTLFADRNLGKGDISNGLYIDFGNMIPGAGWLSAGPGYRHWYAKDQVLIEGSAAVSVHAYKEAYARFELPRLARSRFAVGTQIRWQDFREVAYFGEGAESLEAARSEYRLRSQQFVGYATFRPIEWLALDAQLGWLKPTVDRGSGRAVPLARDERTSAFTEVAITADTRDFPAHPTRGVILRAAAARHTDRDGGVFSFRQYESEVAGFVPIADGRVVLAVHGWAVASEPLNGSVPFYLQPSLGGVNTLRSYADYRFHDDYMVIVNTEVRVAMMTHVDAAFFVDAGNVANRWRDLNLDRKSYGGGLRFHTRRQTFALFDVAQGDEGWRLLLRLRDPLDLARLARRGADLPFVP